MKAVKKITGLLMSLLLFVGIFAGCGNANSSEASSSTASKLEEIKKRGTVRIGVFSDKPPFGYVDSNGKNQGYDVYIAKRHTSLKTIQI